MGADRKGPLAAFVVIAIIAAVLLVTSVRSQAAPGWLDPNRLPAAVVAAPPATDPHLWAAVTSGVHQVVQDGVVLAKRAASGDTGADVALVSSVATGLPTSDAGSSSNGTTPPAGSHPAHHGHAPVPPAHHTTSAPATGHHGHHGHHGHPRHHGHPGHPQGDGNDPGDQDGGTPADPAAPSAPAPHDHGRHLGAGHGHANGHGHGHGQGHAQGHSHGHGHGHGHSQGHGHGHGHDRSR